MLGDDEAMGDLLYSCIMYHVQREYRSMNQSIKHDPNDMRCTGYQVRYLQVGSYLTSYLEVPRQPVISSSPSHLSHRATSALPSPATRRTRALG